MDFYSVWPFFACMALLFVLVSTPLFSRADEAPGKSAGRLRSIDGLRGYAALAVLFHHTVYYRFFLIDGRWGYDSAGSFYHSLGPAGVAMFFMVTGHLFWSRLLNENGKLNWGSLYVGRFFRIVPLHTFAIIVMAIFALAGAGWQLNTPLPILIGQVMRWLGFGFLGYPEINGLPLRHLHLLLAGVLWTLHIEWLFYFSLPFVAVVARSRRAHLPVILTALSVCLGWLLLNPDHWRKMDIVCPALFLIGMASASLQANKVIPPLQDRVASGIVITALMSVFVTFPVVYAAVPIVLLGVAFYLVSSGCTVFGLLTCTPARRLGDISYGIYLLQGLLLAAVFQVGPMPSFALSSPLAYWTLALACAALLIVVATATYVLIEMPGIALGRRVAALLRKPASRATDRAKHPA